MSRTGVPLALLPAVLFNTSTPLAKLPLGSVAPKYSWPLDDGRPALSRHWVRLRTRPSVACYLTGAGGQATLRMADVPRHGFIISAGRAGGQLLLMRGFRRTTLRVEEFSVPGILAPHQSGDDRLEAALREAQAQGCRPLPGPLRPGFIICTFEGFVLKVCIDP